MSIAIYIKSGTGGHYDYGSDKLVKEFKDTNFPIPRINEIIEILEPNDAKKTNQNGDMLKEYHQYLVTDVHYWIASEDFYGVSVYVLPIGRSVN